MESMSRAKIAGFYYYRCQLGSLRYECASLLVFAFFFLFACSLSLFSFFFLIYFLFDLVENMCEGGKKIKFVFLL